MSAGGINLLRTKIFDKSKWMQLPRDVVIGHDVISEVPTVCEDLDLGETVLIITGERTRNIAGKQVEALLAGSYDVTVFPAAAGDRKSTRLNSSH